MHVRLIDFQETFMIKLLIQSIACTKHYLLISVNETCDSITCSGDATCLRHSKSGRPVCVNCDKKCAQSLTVPVCGTDGKTHLSYCHMVNYGCKTGKFITALRQGPCKNSRLQFKGGRNTFYLILERVTFTLHHYTRCSRICFLDQDFCFQGVTGRQTLLQFCHNHT